MHSTPQHIPVAHSLRCRPFTVTSIVCLCGAIAIVLAIVSVYGRRIWTAHTVRATARRIGSEIQAVRQHAMERSVFTAVLVPRNTDDPQNPITTGESEATLLRGCVLDAVPDYSNEHGILYGRFRSYIGSHWIELPSDVYLTLNETSATNVIRRYHKIGGVPFPDEDSTRKIERMRAILYRVDGAAIMPSGGDVRGGIRMTVFSGQRDADGRIYPRNDMGMSVTIVVDEFSGAISYK